MAKIVTLEEIERHWSIDDLADAHDAMDVESELQEFYQNKNESEQKKAMGKVRKGRR